MIATARCRSEERIGVARGGMAEPHQGCKLEPRERIIISSYNLVGDSLMPEDKVIKTGQLTLPRLLFLVVSGGVIALFVAQGGVWLSVGYLAVTLVLCVLLFLVAIDYGVKMDKVVTESQTAPSSDVAVAAAAETARVSVSESRPKRRASRPTKRRR